MNGKHKGNAFERLVSKMIIQAAGEPYTAKDCYRTPLSGGHQYAQCGDHVISPRLQKVFPFTVECKHRKGWGVFRFFNPTKEETSWLDQAITEAKDKRSGGRSPLLVVRGNHQEIFCAVPRLRFSRYIDEVLSNGPGPWGPSHVLFFLYKHEEWMVLRFKTFLEFVAKRSAQKRESVR